MVHTRALLVGLAVTVLLTILQVVCVAAWRYDDTHRLARVYQIRLETRMRTLKQKAEVMRSLVSALDGQVTQAAFEPLAVSLMDEGIQSIQCLPDGVVTWCYPIQDNEVLLGTSVFTNPERQEAAQRAKESGLTNLSGPFAMIQGGYGMMVRSPIWLTDEDGGRSFWGFSAIALLMPQALEPLQLDELAYGGFDYSLTASNGGVLASSTGGPLPAEDQASLLHRPVTAQVSAVDQTWLLRIAPAAGWIHWQSAAWTFLLGLSASVAAAVLIARSRERKKLQRQLELDDAIMRHSLEHSGLAVFLYDPDTKVIECLNDNWVSRKLGRRIENVPEAFLDTLVMEESHEKFLQMYRRIGQGACSASCVIHTNLKSGVAGWERVTLTRLHFEQQGLEDQIIGWVEDVTREKENEIKLENERNYRQAMIEKSLVWLEADLSRDLLLTVNGEAVPGQSYDASLREQVAHLVYSEDAEHVFKSFCSQHLRGFYFKNGIASLQLEYRRDSGTGYQWSAGSVYLSQNAENGTLRMLLIVHDIDDRKKDEIRLRHQAERDPLTGLYNRAAAQAMIDEYLAQQLEGVRCALLMLDLDNFKMVNDKFGHAQGDAALQEVGEKLRTRLRKSDILARLGGDEFIVFLPDVDSVQAVGELASELVDRLQATYTRSGESVSISASIGVAMTPGCGTRFSQLYHASDAAMYQVKNGRKNGYSILENY